MIFAGKRVWQFFLLGNVSLAPGLWLKNIFVPMFGQADWQGRLMSFFMRLMNVIVRGALLMIWLTVVAAIFLVWPIVPLVVVYFLRRSLM
ncbi:MAG: hypothetical protein HY984_01260 [Candidatus Magasanikbacteria bacterium]|nr:hypothetical protein [Candidatus Magasanikbacteria bacterium]